jgi:hypothetical protein
MIHMTNKYAVESTGDAPAYRRHPNDPTLSGRDSGDPILQTSWKRIGEPQHVIFEGIMPRYLKLLYICERHRGRRCHKIGQPPELDS